MVGIHLGLGFLFLPLLIFGQPQLFAAALEILGALRLHRRIDLRREALDRDARIQAVRIPARLCQDRDCTS